MSYNDSKITRYEQEYIKNTNAIVNNSPVTCDDMVITIPKIIIFRFILMLSK